MSVVLISHKCKTPCDQVWYTEPHHLRKLFCPYCGTLQIDEDRTEYEKVRGQVIDENVPPEI